MFATMGRRHKPTPIGIDFGESGTRAVQLQRCGDVYRIRCAVRSEQSIGVVDGADRAKRRVQELRSCLGQGEFHGRAAVAAVNAPDAEFHALELPAGTPAELDQIVRWEVERLMTDSKGEAEIRYWTLPPTSATAPNAVGVAAPRAAVTENLATCREGRLACTAVDTGATALGQFGAILNRWNSDVVWGILDLGYRQTRVVICTDDVPVLVRSTGQGGRAWTERIVEALETSFKTAEVQKRDHGIALSSRGVRKGTNDAASVAPSSDLAAMLLGILRSNLNDLASEVKRSYEYVLSCYPSRQAADLVLVGGGAAMRNLPEFLTDSLGIPVRRAGHYLEGSSGRLSCGPDLTGQLESLALAVGLALED